MSTFHVRFNFSLMAFNQGRWDRPEGLMRGGILLFVTFPMWYICTLRLHSTCLGSHSDARVKFPVALLLGPGMRIFHSSSWLPTFSDQTQCSHCSRVFFFWDACKEQVFCRLLYRVHFFFVKFKSPPCCYRWTCAKLSWCVMSFVPVYLI